MFIQVKADMYDLINKLKDNNVIWLFIAFFELKDEVVFAASVSVSCIGMNQQSVEFTVEAKIMKTRFLWFVCISLKQICIIYQQIEN